MNPSIKHRDTEYRAKEHLRHQYQSHRTSIDNYERPELTGYEGQIYNLAYNVGGYIIEFKGERDYREYLNTATIDF